jgi:hypothetical protein
LQEIEEAAHAVGLFLEIEQAKQVEQLGNFLFGLLVSDVGLLIACCRKHGVKQTCLLLDEPVFLQELVAQFQVEADEQALGVAQCAGKFTFVCRLQRKVIEISPDGISHPVHPGKVDPDQRLFPHGAVGKLSWPGCLQQQISVGCLPLGVLEEEVDLLVMIQRVRHVGSCQPDQPLFEMVETAHEQSEGRALAEVRCSQLAGRF